MSQSINDTLKERGSRYGKFANHAELSQNLKNAVFTHINQYGITQLQPYQVEAMEMILHKVARIANGDPYYDDSWRDIAGYAQLVVDILNEKDKS